MATTISNTVKTYAPTLMRGASKIFPSLSGPLQMGAALIDRKRPFKPNFGAPKATASTVQQAPQPSGNYNSQSYSAQSAPQAQGTSQPVNGLLKPDYSSLSNQLGNINSGLMQLQKEKEANAFAPIVADIRSASNPSNNQTGILQSIKDTASGFAPIGAEAKRISDMYAAEIARVGGLGAGAVAGALSTGTDVVGSGNAAIASQSASSRMSALSAAQQAALEGTGQQLTAQTGQAGAFGTALGGANTQQAQQLSGLGSAAGFAQPQLAGIDSQMYYNPLQAGQQQGGGSGASQQQAFNYAQEVASGRRSYDDAVQAMGLYGPVGKQVLDSVIRQQNPDFNFAQAQSLANQQGEIGPKYQFALDALTNVEGALNQLGGAQKTGVPLWNQFANFASLQTGVGGEKSRQYIGAVQSLRNAYAALLASAKGGLPTDYSAQAIAEVPDMPTPNDIKAIRHNLETLGAIRQNIYGNPGAATGSATSGTNNQGWGWNP